METKDEVFSLRAVVAVLVRRISPQEKRVELSAQEITDTLAEVGDGGICVTENGSVAVVEVLSAERLRARDDDGYVHAPRGPGA